MGRRGFGKVAMRNELYRRDAERIRMMHDTESWESAARSLSMLILSGKYKMAKEMAGALVALPAISPHGLDATVAVYAERARKAYARANGGGREHGRQQGEPDDRG